MNTHYCVINGFGRSQSSIKVRKTPSNHQTLKNTTQVQPELQRVQVRLHFAPLIWQNKDLGVNTPSDPDLLFFYPLLEYSARVQDRVGVRFTPLCLYCWLCQNQSSKHLISVMGTQAQCITLITLASHFSSEKPSPGLTATGCTLGQSLLHHQYQQRAKKVLT